MAPKNDQVVVLDGPFPSVLVKSKEATIDDELKDDRPEFVQEDEAGWVKAE